MLIPAGGPYVANYKAEWPIPGRPVVAWDDRDGHPMVVGERGLVRAEECGPFTHLTRCRQPVTGGRSVVSNVFTEDDAS